VPSEGSRYNLILYFNEEGCKGDINVKVMKDEEDIIIC
jgi:hypothetical protein